MHTTHAPAPHYPTTERHKTHNFFSIFYFFFPLFHFSFPSFSFCFFLGGVFGCFFVFFLFLLVSVGTESNSRIFRGVVNDPQHRILFVCQGRDFSSFVFTGLKKTFFLYFIIYVLCFDKYIYTSMNTRVRLYRK